MALSARRSRDAWADDSGMGMGMDDDDDLDQDLDAGLDDDEEIAAAMGGRGAGRRSGGGRRGSGGGGGGGAGAGAGAGAAGGAGQRGRQARESRVRVADDAEQDDEDLAYRTDLENRERDRRRAGISESFKCRNCRNFIGTPPTGGSQRNHCPMCLFSLHVDGKTPGDRASDCHSLMEPIGVFYRITLEQMVVHRCRGCDFVRYNRVAADDNVVILGQLPIIDPASLPHDGDA